MYKLCKTEQSAQRQRQLEAGLLAVMGKTRYEDISISDLCEQIGVPRKTFYRYFSGKDGALHALIDHTLMSFETFPVATDRRTLLSDMGKFFRFWQHQKPLLDALQRSKLSGLLIQRAVDYSISEEAFPSRFLPGESRYVQQHVVMFGVCGLLSMTLQWHHSGYDRSVQEMAKLAVRLLTQALFPEAQNLL